jgi:hypothetical protein
MCVDDRYQSERESERARARDDNDGSAMIMNQVRKQWVVTNKQQEIVAADVVYSTAQYYCIVEECGIAASRGR